ncbi:MAG: type II secretion system F family protein [Patescibacteria group bacterium]
MFPFKKFLKKIKLSKPKSPKTESILESKAKYNVPFFSRSRLSIKDQTLFAKRMSFLINAGVSILESMHVIREQMTRRGTRSIFDQIIFDISNGTALSVSLSRHKGVFGVFMINLVRVGETSGVLGKNLNYLASELEKKDALRRKILGALVYPAFISTATIALVVLLTVFMFPKILPIFAGLNVSLPWTTIALIWVSDFLQHQGLWVLLGAIAFSTLMFILYEKVPKFSLFVDKTFLRLPVFGPMMLDYNLANFCRTLGLMLKSGVTVTESLRVLGDATPNLYYRKECYHIYERVNTGERISLHLRTNPRYFPPILTHMVVVGEMTGQLPDSLMYLAEFYEKEVDDRTKNLSNSIEPIMMIVLGIIVGFVAVSIITPIYGITQKLSR